MSNSSQVTRFERREVLRLLGYGGVIYASGLAGCASRPEPNTAAAARSQPMPLRTSDAEHNPLEDFIFLQLSDTHWGYSGPANPESATTLPKAVATINASALRPDFVVFTGDLTQTTDDAGERRRRMKEFKSIVSELRVEKLYYLPGEHDAALDGGAAFREHFGDPYYSFTHKGLHFVALDNVSDPAAQLGEAQLAWLEQDLRSAPASAPTVVLAHRPLFDLYPAWDWLTRDGHKALELLERRKNVSVFYGHIHQQHETTTGSIVHRAARSLVFPLPAPGSLPKKAPLAWVPNSSDHGLGYRSVAERAAKLETSELALT